MGPLRLTAIALLLVLTATRARAESDGYVIGTIVVGAPLTGLGLGSTAVGAIGGGISIGTKRNRLVWAIINDLSAVINIGAAVAWGDYLSSSTERGGEGQYFESTAVGMTSLHVVSAAVNLGLGIAGHVLHAQRGREPALRYGATPLLGRDERGGQMVGLALSLTGF